MFLSRTWVDPCSLTCHEASMVAEVLSPGDKTLVRALKVLESGGLVVYPTETTYGIAARSDCSRALKRLAILKGRHAHSPFALVAHSARVVASCFHLPPELRPLANVGWPGPLTLVLRPRHPMHPLLTASTQTVGVRIPGHRLAQGLAKGGTGLVTATSANEIGLPPANHLSELSKNIVDGVELIIDAGPTPGGMPSTLVALVDGVVTVLREGAVSCSDIEAMLGVSVGLG